MTIRNPLGDVHVRNADARQLLIHAVIQRLAPGAAAEIHRRSRGAQASITVVAGSRRRGSAKAPRERVDLAVFVPRGLAVRIETAAGQITANRLPGPINARSGAGAILASSENRLDLASDSGPIRATVLGERWSGRAAVRSRGGRITLVLPEGTDIRFTARTCGPLTLNVTAQRTALARACERATGQFGDGRYRIDAASDTGGIVVQTWRPDLSR